MCYLITGKQKNTINITVIRGRFLVFYTLKFVGIYIKKIKFLVYYNYVILSKFQLHQLLYLHPQQ